MSAAGLVESHLQRRNRMKKQSILRIVVLLLGTACAAYAQHAIPQTSRPYFSARGYVITDSSAVCSADSLAAFPALPENFSENAGLVRKFEPYFPEELLSAGAEGDVLVAGYVDSSGVVRKAVVLSSTEQRFNKHALYALIQWQFDPRKSTDVWIKVPFRFRIAK
jgi:TonB family protein